MSRRKKTLRSQEYYEDRDPDLFDDPEDDFDDFDDDLDDDFDDDFDGNPGDDFGNNPGDDVDNRFDTADLKDIFDDAPAPGARSGAAAGPKDDFDDFADDDDDLDFFEDEEDDEDDDSEPVSPRGRRGAAPGRRTRSRKAERAGRERTARRRSAGAVAGESDGNSKKKKLGGILFYVIPVVLLAVIVVSGYFFLSDLLSYKKASDEYRALEKFIVVKKEPRVEIPVDEDTEEEDTFPNMDIDYDALAAINSDFVGVLYIPSLELFYPVVISHDNDEYLDRTFEGTINPSGSIFMDCYASRELTDSNTLIYGHNMKNETMFGSLKKLSTERGFDGYEEDPFFYIYTKERVFKYEIFSFHTTPVDGYVYDGFSGEAGYDSYVQKAQADFDVTLKSLDRERLHEYDFSERPDMVTLSTCWGTGHTHNFVVHGVLAHKFIF
ncbi:MAG: class B sortase [Lachnospiraceae bacterium]|nr:class B sortase [Lachnospiraceae bacterium]